MAMNCNYNLQAEDIRALFLFDSSFLQVIPLWLQCVSNNFGDLSHEEVGMFLRQPTYFKLSLHTLATYSIAACMPDYLNLSYLNSPHIRTHKSM